MRRSYALQLPQPAPEAPVVPCVAGAVVVVVEGGGAVVVVTGAAATVVGVDAELEAPVFDAAGVVVAGLEPVAGAVVVAVCCEVLPLLFDTLGIDTLTPPGIFTVDAAALPLFDGVLEAPLPVDGEPAFAASFCKAASAA